MAVNDNKAQSRSRDCAAKRLKQWQLHLQNNPESAKKAIMRAMGVLVQQNAWDQYDLARFYSQMKNGTAHPSDFVSDDGSICELRRA